MSLTIKGREPGHACTRRPALHPLANSSTSATVPPSRLPPGHAWTTRASVIPRLAARIKAASPAPTARPAAAVSTPRNPPSHRWRPAGAARRRRPPPNTDVVASRGAGCRGVAPATPCQATSATQATVGTLGVVCRTEGGICLHTNTLRSAGGRGGQPDRHDAR